MAYGRALKAYAVDLRQWVLAAVDHGMGRAAVAATVGVSVATINRLVALRRIHGDRTAQRPSGRRRPIATNACVVQ